MGLADFHSHQFGGLGFGGQVVTHDNDPTTGCATVLSFDSSGNRVKDIVRNQLLAEAKAQESRNECYPTTSSPAGQREDTDNLKRAWQYGLRLQVVLAVSNEFLCYAGDLAEGRTGGCPKDHRAVVAQLKAATALEAKIDAESGGPGRGWYRIVRTPAEARSVIRDGKLAVVLGTEAQNAFGCDVVARDTVPGVRDLFENRPEEQTYKLTCPGRAHHPEYQLQKALAYFEEYWQLGARHFFPVHNMDGFAGGTALSIPLLHSDTNPIRLDPADILDRTGDINAVVTAIRPPVESVPCAQFEFDRPAGTPGRCNSKGLTPGGRSLIRMMASHGAIIDIDHMSLKMKNEVTGDEGPLGGVYPLVSSHGGVVAISHGDKKSEGELTEPNISAIITTGGAFAPLLPTVNSTSMEDTYPADATVAKHTCGGTTESYVQAYRYLADKLRNGKQRNGKPAYVGIGFGSDFTAPGTGGPQPRFAAEPGQVGNEYETVKGGPLVSGGLCYFTGAPGAPPQLTYPFTSTSPLSAGMQFDKSNVGWSGMKPTDYDIGLDGMAHVGMIPDFVEELRTMGLTQADLDPLWHGAEAYLRAWEAADSWTGDFTDEKQKGIAAQCAELRNTLGSAPIDPATGLSRENALLDQLKQTGCFGT